MIKNHFSKLILMSLAFAPMASASTVPPWVDISSCVNKPHELIQSKEVLGEHARDRAKAECEDARQTYLTADKCDVDCESPIFAKDCTWSLYGTEVPVRPQFKIQNLAETQIATDKPIDYPLVNRVDGMKPLHFGGFILQVSGEDLLFSPEGKFLKSLGPNGYGCSWSLYLDSGSGFAEVNSQGCLIGYTTLRVTFYQANGEILKTLDVQSYERLFNATTAADGRSIALLLGKVEANDSDSYYPGKIWVVNPDGDVVIKKELLNTTPGYNGRTNIGTGFDGDLWVFFPDLKVEIVSMDPAKPIRAFQLFTPPMADSWNPVYYSPIPLGLQKDGSLGVQLSANTLTDSAYVRVDRQGKVQTIPAKSPYRSASVGSDPEIGPNLGFDVDGNLRTAVNSSSLYKVDGQDVRSTISFFENDQVVSQVELSGFQTCPLKERSNGMILAEEYKLGDPYYIDLGQSGYVRDQAQVVLMDRQGTLYQKLLVKFDQGISLSDLFDAGDGHSYAFFFRQTPKRVWQLWRGDFEVSRDGCFYEFPRKP